MIIKILFLLQQQRQLSPVAKSEDSDMSAVSTTDSGNGGSDEDVRNHPQESGWY